MEFECWIGLHWCRKQRDQASWSNRSNLDRLGASCHRSSVPTGKGRQGSHVLITNCNQQRNVGTKTSYPPNLNDTCCSTRRNELVSDKSRQLRRVNRRRVLLKLYVQAKVDSDVDFVRVRRVVYTSKGAGRRQDRMHFICLHLVFIDWSRNTQPKWGGNKFHYNVIQQKSLLPYFIRQR